MKKNTGIFTGTAKLPLIMLLIFAAVTAYYRMYELAVAEASVAVAIIFLSHDGPLEQLTRLFGQYRRSAQ